MTIIAGFRCQNGIVICADTQETEGATKRNVPKLLCINGPVVGPDARRLVNHDLSLAICGAGNGPFIDKLTSQAWDSIRHVTSVWDAAERVQSMIKETYTEFGSIYQVGECPTVDLIYGIKLGGESALFQATGPIVNEVGYASCGRGRYLADFLTTRMRGEGYLPIRHTVALAAYILLQTREHVDGCGGESHIAVLRETESSGMVAHNLVEHLTDYLRSADHCTGGMLLASADFSIPRQEVEASLDNSLNLIKAIRDQEIERLRNDKLSHLKHLLGGELVIVDDLGLPVAAPAEAETTDTPLP